MIRIRCIPSATCASAARQAGLAKGRSGYKKRAPMNEKESSTRLAIYSEKRLWHNTRAGKLLAQHRPGEAHGDTVTVTCPRCNSELSVTLRGKSELKRLAKQECSGCVAQRAAENRHLETRCFREVQRQDHSTSSWKSNRIIWLVRGYDQGARWAVEQIKTHTSFRRRG